jgi:hypothetical protein
MVLWWYGGFCVFVFVYAILNTEYPKRNIICILYTHVSRSLHGHGLFTSYTYHHRSYTRYIRHLPLPLIHSTSQGTLLFSFTHSRVLVKVGIYNYNLGIPLITTVSIIYVLSLPAVPDLALRRKSRRSTSTTSQALVSAFHPLRY